MLVIQLFEAPIEDFTLLGNWEKNSSFRQPTDRKLLSNPKAQMRVIQKWLKTVVPFNMYFVNSPEAGRWKEIGEVSLEWLENAMPKTVPQLKLRDDAVNVIFTNNSGDQWKPMTAWIIAHRFGHAIRNQPMYENIHHGVYKQISRILTNTYGETEPSYYMASSYNLSDDERATRSRWEKMMVKFCALIGTFRSARTHTIRNKYEFVYELLAQYITTGTIKFNPVPESFSHGRLTWGRPTHYTSMRDRTAGPQVNQQLAELAANLTAKFEELLHSCVGKTFVM